MSNKCVRLCVSVSNAMLYVVKEVNILLCSEIFFKTNFIGYKIPIHSRLRSIKRNGCTIRMSEVTGKVADFRHNEDHTKMRSTRTGGAMING